MTPRRLRVVQWATGDIGRRALREVIRHPDLDLVGLVVYDPAKAGHDAGDLCDEASTGVLATTDRATIVALDADCVVYMPQQAVMDDVVAMLERGTNIVTTCGDFQASGRALDDTTRARVAQACQRGRASIYATGSSPGFITEVMPFALLSMQRRVDVVEIEEYANLSQRNSPELLFDLMGYGKPMGPVDEGRAQYLHGQFHHALARVAEAAGRPVDKWSAYGEVAAARETVILAAGELEAGTVGAQRTVISGDSGGSEIVRFTATWYCTTDLEPQWDLLPTGWRMRVRGDAPFNVVMEFPFAVEDLGPNTPGYTANRPVNAIAYVCAAEPGILATEDLPPITPAGPGWNQPA